MYIIIIKVDIAKTTADAAISILFKADGFPLVFKTLQSHPNKFDLQPFWL